MQPVQPVPPVPAVPPPPLVPGSTPGAAEPRGRQQGEGGCPWCGSGRLRGRVVARCRDCGHTFRRRDHRPLDAGRLADPAERVLPVRALRRRHRAAARAVLLLAEPESWLDVGTGDARFPEAARQVLPYTSFDGLDATPRVIEAQRAGRVEEAHQGRLTAPDVLARLRCRYDVVSMFHHLEHTPDPRAELRAALAVLRPGGHLVVQATDPGSAYGVLLGRWWLPLGGSRPAHLVPPAALRAELRARGCTIVATAGGHLPHDLAGAVRLALAPALREAATPVIAAASALDHALSPALRHTPFRNTYRVIARKDFTTGGQRRTRP